MSDSIKDLVRHYEDNVFLGHPRNIGLFPIPEYPEYESGRGMWSETLETILTTLRYLAPATLLTLFWGQQSFLFRLLKCIDNAFRAIVFSSEEQKQSVLQWLAEAGAVRVEHLDTVWRHGWILCGVLDGALPGACAGHPPTRLSLKHAQAIADHYLGVEPVFTRQELETNDSLSKHQEWKLATYLDRIREALSKITPPVSKPTSQRTSPETAQFTMDYVARGTGLTAAQVNNKMNFKIFPTSQQCLDPGEITILIRGPKDTYGMSVLPPILGKTQLIRQKLLNLEAKPNYTENALPITQGTTYMRTYGKNNMNTTYYIPKSKYDIEIEEDIREDHMKISYIVTHEGKYEISITSRGQNIVGSPFQMSASKNIIGILDRESFCLEDGEEIEIVDVKTDRKVVLRIVDFITEKMLLNENGSLEKISDDDAKRLMAADDTLLEKHKSTLDLHDTQMATNSYSDIETSSIKFKKTASKIIQMNRVCKIIKELTLKARNKYEEKTYNRPRSHQKDIPDVVNSTFNEPNYTTFSLTEKRDKIIVPENLSVNLRTEVARAYDLKKADLDIIDSPLSTPIKSNSPDSLEKYETLEQQIEEGITADQLVSSNNPFFNDLIEQSYTIEKDLGSFVKTEYETNNSQVEETQDSSIKITVEEYEDRNRSSTTGNPFIDVMNIERPKTPVLKIISGEVKDRDDSVYVDPKTAQIAEEMLGNEFINPFFLHHHGENQQEPVTDFIIGAPVSLPPIVRAQTPEPTMESIIITSALTTKRDNEKAANNIDDSTSPLLSTPLHTNKQKNSSTFHSIDSNVSDNVEILSLSNASDNQDHLERNTSPKKDMWDSAYVSIDDNNSSPDSNNNNDNHALSDTSSKHKLSPSDDKYTLPNMGPAERELWQNCSELKQDMPQVCEDVKLTRWETKRLIFTPIIEESDRSISSGMKEVKKQEEKKMAQTEPDSVKVAFAEINDLYQEYFPTSEVISSTIIDENVDNDVPLSSIEEKSVNSASEITDVKRHAATYEGTISEIQANVTESVSVSHPLHLNTPDFPTSKKTSDEIHFGDKSHTNIVLEKKQYWDEKIREIENETEANKTQHRRRRLSSRHLRHNDSLTKRRGKEIAKSFVTENRKAKTQTTEIKEIINAKSPLPSFSPQSDHNEVKLVEKWKKFWDSKLELDKDDTESTCFKAKSPKPKTDSISSQQLRYSHSDVIEACKDTPDNMPKSPTKPHVKQELPEEEVFKAFETSPKRFFGTSRKQILSKIDTFLGKVSTVDESSTDATGASKDIGLVSSRVSMFHKISLTEDKRWNNRMCQSMHNIAQQKDSENNNASTEQIFTSKCKKTVKEGEMDVNSNLKSHSIPSSEKSKDVTDIKNVDSKQSAKFSLKDKRAKLNQSWHTETVDETQKKKETEGQDTQTCLPSVQKVMKVYNKQSPHIQKYIQQPVLRKSSISKSEMDIFSKTTSKFNPTFDDDLETHKSYDALPKISVKNVISLYESVSRTDLPRPVRKLSRTAFSNAIQNQKEISSSSGAVNTATRFTTVTEKPAMSKQRTKSESNTEDLETYTWTNRVSSQISKFDSNADNEIIIPKLSQRRRWTNRSVGSVNSLQQSTESINVEIVSTEDLEKEATRLSNVSLDVEEAPEKDEETQEENTYDTDYKSRFKLAKQFFKSLEELRDEKKPRKLNECELLLKNSTESLENERPQKRVKKNIKSHSLPSSEISKIWNQLQESQSASNSKLVKISERFNVDDLFTDVMEGRLSRQGSLRGIPHKKAVLEAFRSMENITDNNLSPYNVSVSQLTDLPLDSKAKIAQTYLREYPYLPTTDPSKSHSRVDAKASGLICLKELMNQKPRRRSVPDIRLNTKFTVDL